MRFFLLLSLVLLTIVSVAAERTRPPPFQLPAHCPLTDQKSCWDCCVEAASAPIICGYTCKNAIIAAGGGATVAPDTNSE